MPATRLQGTYAKTAASRFIGRTSYAVKNALGGADEPETGTGHTTPDG